MYFKYNISVMLGMVLNSSHVFGLFKPDCNPLMYYFETRFTYKKIRWREVK